MTIGSVCICLGITRQTWLNMSRQNDELSLVLHWAEDLIWCQKFQLAAAGVVNANIISSELGLKTRVETSSEAQTLEEFLDNLEEDIEVDYKEVERKKKVEKEKQRIGYMPIQPDSKPVRPYRNK